MTTRTPQTKNTRSTLSKLRAASKSNKVIAVVVAIGIAVTGFIVFSAQAANLFASLDFSNASLSGTTRVNDSKASGGKALQFGQKQTTPTPDPDPDPTPTPSSWQAAWDSRNQATIDAWYKANTGFTALGYNSSSFKDISSDNTIDQAWLNANNGNGHVKQSGGRWIVEKVRSSRIRIAANNVTIRGCLVNGGGSTLYGIQNHPTWSNSVTGTIVEYCTLNGQNSEGVGILLAGSGTGTTAATVRHTEIYGWRGGIQMYGDITFEYNRSHSVYYFSGSHNTAASNRGANVRIIRNSLEDGNSSALSIYADNLIHNLVVEQNIFNTPRANYCVNFPAKDYFDQTYDTHLRNNIFGQKHNPKCGSSGPMAGGKWTTKSGNIFINGSPAF